METGVDPEDAYFAGNVVAMANSPKEVSPGGSPRGDVAPSLPSKARILVTPRFMGSGGS